MKPRERFVTALNCGISDRVPVYDFLFSRKLMNDLLGYTTQFWEGKRRFSGTKSAKAFFIKAGFPI